MLYQMTLCPAGKLLQVLITSFYRTNFLRSGNLGLCPFLLVILLLGPLSLSSISQQFMELLYINMCFVCPCRLCSATLVDLQLLSNTYCQASETCSLSFARHRPANSTCYINKKNSCCYACQDPARVSVCESVREEGMWGVWWKIPLLGKCSSVSVWDFNYTMVCNHT